MLVEETGTEVDVGMGPEKRCFSLLYSRERFECVRGLNFLKL
jgi:hypothetical protein